MSPAALNPNQLADREAMGLPASVVTRVDARRLTAACRSLTGLETDELVRRAEDPGLPFVERYAAATMLGLLGDPRIDALDPRMIDVPGGTILLGLPPERVDAVTDAWSHVGVQREWIEKETPEYLLEVRRFRIARYPVTNSEYLLFLQETESEELPTSWTFGVYPDLLGNHPVWGVCAQAADAYAAWLSARTGRRFRLPSEAEWEYAASGGERREFPWGNGFEDTRANTVESGPLHTTPVGIFPAGRSPLGLDDMAGNVEEFVADDYRPYPGGTRVEDDLLVSAGNYRVARGGSFTRFGDLARCARRHGRYGKAIYVMGFRIAETP